MRRRLHRQGALRGPGRRPLTGGPGQAGHQALSHGRGPRHPRRGAGSPGQLSSPGFCGGWFIWCRWLPVVIVPGGGGRGWCRAPRRLRARRGYASRWRSEGEWCPYQWTLDISALRASSRNDLADGGGSWLRESRARGDLDSGASEHLADRPGPKLLLLGLDVLADQRDGRSHCAAIDKPTVLFRIALALRSSRTSFSSSLIRCAWSVVVPGRVPWSIWAFLTQVRRASGWTPSSSPNPTDRALGPRRVSQHLQRHPHGPLPQLIGVPRLSHDSDPSVSSLPPTNPGRFSGIRWVTHSHLTHRLPPGWPR